MSPQVARHLGLGSAQARPTVLAVPVLDPGVDSEGENAPWRHNVTPAVPEEQANPEEPPEKKAKKKFKELLASRASTLEDLFEKSYLEALKHNPKDLVKVLSQTVILKQLVRYLLPYDRWPAGRFVGENNQVNVEVEEPLKRVLHQQTLAEELLQVDVDEFVSAATNEDISDMFFAFLDLEKLDSQVCACVFGTRACMLRAPC
jgi:hypothetical protein